MIKISKTTAIPAVLLTRGKTKQAQHCRDYDLAPADYDIGKRKFAFDATIYGDVSVKQVLIEAQHGKCCYCERKIGSDGDIEHFRPKASCCQGENFPLERPGYYWLAYDWNNLFLACSTCNQRHKKNFFPLADPAKRAKNHHTDVLQEVPLFINPAQTDPARHIAFRKEIPYAKNGNRYAMATIKALGLDRENLNEKRREHLDRLISLRKVLDQEELNSTFEGRQILEETRIFLSEATLDTAEFTAMSRAAAAVDFRITTL